MSATNPFASTPGVGAQPPRTAPASAPTPATPAPVAAAVPTPAPAQPAPAPQAAAEPAPAAAPTSAPPPVTVVVTPAPAPAASPSPVVAAPAPQAPPAPQAAAPAPIAPPGIRPPGGALRAPGVPGMSTPGPHSPGAGAGSIKHRFRIPEPVQGLVHLRPSRYIQPKRGGNASLIFEVFDERETQKANNGQKSMAGGEVMVTLWPDRRTADLFAAMGYPESTWTDDGEGGYLLPVDAVLYYKPLMRANVEQVEGKTPGRTFANCSEWTLVRASTTQQAAAQPPAGQTGAAS